MLLTEGFLSIEMLLFTDPGPSDVDIYTKSATLPPGKTAKRNYKLHSDLLCIILKNRLSNFLWTMFPQFPRMRWLSSPSWCRLKGNTIKINTFRPHFPIPLTFSCSNCKLELLTWMLTCWRQKLLETERRNIKDLFMFVFVIVRVICEEHRICWH